MFSISYTYNKMDKVFREKDLMPIRHREFNEFIKRKGFKGRNNYKLADLKAMFGFKPMITGSPVTISSNELEPTRFDSMSKASTSTGIPYITLLYAKKNSRKRVRSNGKKNNNLSLVKMPRSSFKWRATEFNTGAGKCSCGQTFECASEREIAMKRRMHRRFCSNPLVAFNKIRVSKKATTMKEQQLNEAERIRKVHN